MPIPNKRNMLAPLEEVLKENEEGFSEIHLHTNEEEEEIDDSILLEEEEYNDEYTSESEFVEYTSPDEYEDFSPTINEEDNSIDEEEFYDEEEPVLLSSSSPLQDSLSQLTKHTLFKPVLIGAISLIVLVVLSLSVYFLFFRSTVDKHTQEEDLSNTTIVHSGESLAKSDYGAHLIVTNVQFDITEGVKATLQFNQDVEGQLYTIFKENEHGKLVACSSEENSFSADLKKEIDLECTRKMTEAYSLADQYFISSQGNEINKKGE